MGMGWRHIVEQPPRALAWVLLGLAAWIGLRHGIQLRGDGCEYILQTQAIALRGTLRIEPDAARAYWNRTNPFGWMLEETRPPTRELSEQRQAGGGFGGLYPDRFGAYRYYHFWGYSLAIAPLYAALHWVWPAREYTAFAWMNLFFLALPFGLAWRAAPSWRLLVIGALALLTPLPRYMGRPHSELFCFGLALSSLLLAGQLRTVWLSSLLLAVATAQNPPIVFFFPLHMALALRQIRPCSIQQRLGALTAYLPAAAIILSSMAYFHHYFGSFNLIAQLGMAQFAYTSWSRVCSWLASPLVGAFWFYPLCFLLLPLALNRQRIIFCLWALAGTFAAAWLATTTNNFSSDQIGALRYSTWLLAPLWWVLLSTPSDSCRSRRFIIGTVISLALLLFMRSHRPYSPAAVLYRLTHFADDPEVLAEHIMGREITYPAAFHGAYIWNLPGQESLWLVSRRWADMNPMLLKEITPQPAWRPHALLGEYLLLWRKAQPQEMECDNPVFIRNQQDELIYPRPHTSSGPGTRNKL